MTNEERRAVFAEIMAASGIVRRKPGQFTIEEFAEAEGLTRAAALRILTQQFDRGLLRREKVLEEGHQRWVYWK